MNDNEIVKWLRIVFQVIDNNLKLVKVYYLLLVR